jgi:hypothetical protein
MKTIDAGHVSRTHDKKSAGVFANANRMLPPVSVTDVLYVETDGSMICTRNKERWKESKPARLFKGKLPVRAA